MRTLLSACMFLAASFGAAFSQSVDGSALETADVVIVGEVHDNPVHHEVQARVANEMVPRAVVWEMLEAEQAAKVTADLIANVPALEDALAWEARGWPDFAMYHPIFAATKGARTYGAAVPRAVAYGVVEGDLAIAFDAAAAYGLDRDLPIDEQAARQALQFAAHCEALPEETLPGMVDVQRLRDATLARVTLQALKDTGGPVLVITGNGHARKDWGVPRYIVRVAPQTVMWVIGQGEGGTPPQGGFDQVIDGPAITRPDPCAAFK